MSDFIGSIIDRKYRLTQLIGEGGMSAVFEAEHMVIKRKVAVKILHSRLSSFPDMVNRFFREAQASSAIGHPNIIEIFDVGVREDGTAFIVMELLDGKTLADWMVERESLPSDLTVSIILQVLSALVAAHSKGIIHRDLKPDNIFLAIDNRGRNVVKLLDFGIAKVHGELEGDQGLTKTGTVLGTPNYMSPEQARGKDVDQRIDIWAAGVILYQMLSSKLPFSGQSYNEVLSEILLETPKPIKELVSSIPDGLVAIVEKAMAKNREDRYSSVADMIKDLAPYAGTIEDVMTDSAVEALRDSIIPQPADLRGITGTEKTRMGKGSHDSAAAKKRMAFKVFLFVVVVFIASLFGYVEFVDDSNRPIQEKAIGVFQEAFDFWYSKKDNPIIEETLKALKPIKVSDPVSINKETAIEGKDNSTDSNESENEDTLSNEELKTEENLPKDVTIMFDHLPKGARVTIDGKRYNTPLILSRSYELVTLKITYARHAPFERQIIPNKDQTIEVPFNKKRRSSRSSKKEK